jgi:3,4-dihydroxy 2-butanone 4-phosphate synthase/GTP cyclohydrolase II
MARSSFVSVEEAIAALQQGRMVIVTDAKNRENEGDLIIAAEFIQPAHINFMMTYARGLICMPMTAEHFARLEIPMMTNKNQSKFSTAFGVSIGAREGITTGISAHDRAETVRVASNPNATATDIVMPGHIFPLRAVAGGVLKRPGHTEAATDLMRIAGLSPVAAICEIANDDGTMAQQNDLELFCLRHNLPMLRIEDIVAYRRRNEVLVSEVSSATLPVLDDVVMQIKVFVSELDGLEHVVLQSNIVPKDAAPLVRVHSECFTGDILGSLRCDCGSQLHSAIRRIAKEGGAILYMRQEGRGIGLINKVKAYALQDQGDDTVVANKRLGFAPDMRDYMTAAHMLKALQYNKIRLITNNPNKISALSDLGIEVVEQVAAPGVQNKFNKHYLQTKKNKLGHTFEMEEV